MSFGKHAGLLAFIAISHALLSAESLPLAEVEGDPSAIVAGCVNIISGTFCDSETDLVIPGAENVTFQRFYSSADWQGGCLSDGWNHNYPYDDGILAWEDKKYSIILPEGSGGMLTYGSFEKWRTTASDVKAPHSGTEFGLFDPSKEDGITNTSSEDISGSTHIKNQGVRYLSNPDRAEVTLCTGGMRIFDRTNPGRFLPYLFRLQKETRPNGNCVTYEYAGKELNKINVTDSSGSRTYGSVTISSLRKNGERYERVVTASDGRQITYEMHNSRHKSERSRDTKRYVYRVTRSDGPQQTYHYCPANRDGNEKVIKKLLPDNRYRIIEYYKEGTNDVEGQKVHVKKWENEDRNHAESVKLLKGPVGYDATPITTHRFFYNFRYDKREIVNYTHGTNVQVWDALNHQITYHLLQGKRLGAIERFTGNQKESYQRYSIERFYWGNSSKQQHCNLICRSLEEADGTVRSCRYLVYDAKHNPIVATIMGNLTGINATAPVLNADGIPQENGCERYEVRSTYSNDKYNLRLSETLPNGRTTKYTYKPDSNVCTSKVICDGNRPLAREFYLFDSYNVLNKIIADNGSGSDYTDLSNVTTLLITYIETAQTGPAIGLPIEVKEHYFDCHTGQERPLGRKVNTYSSLGRLTSQEVYDANDAHRYTLRWEHDRMGNVILEQNALGQIIKRSFDENGNKIREEGPATDCHLEYTYDFSNRLISEKRFCKDGQCFEHSYLYDHCSNRIASIDSFGNRTDYLYDELGRLIETKLPPCNSTRLISTQEYDIAGNVVATTDFNGNTTRKRYNIRGQPIEVIHPDQTTEYFEYNLDGSLKRQVAADGTTTLFHRDVLSNIIRKEISSAAGERLSTTTAIYRGTYLISDTDPKGNVTNYEYDAAGRLASVIRPLSRTDYEYDALGRKIRTIDHLDHGNARVTCVDYDLLGRVIEETIEDATGHVFTHSIYELDSAGRRAATTIFTETGPATTRSSYNALGQVTSLVDAEGNETHTHYDYAHIVEGKRVLCITTVDALGNQTITTHDVLGRAASVIKKDAMGTETSVVHNHYDGNGKLIRRVDTVKAPSQPDYAIVTEWSYDQLGRVIGLKEASGTEIQRQTYYQYNATGQKEADIFSDGTSIRYEYDGMGRLSHYTSSDGTISYHYTYDPSGNLLSVRDTVQGSITKRSYNSENQMLYEILANGLTVSYQHDQLGRVTSFTLPDASSVTYEYDCAFLRKVTRNKADRSSYSHHYQTYDQSGHLLKAQLIGTAGEASFEWDKMGRVTHFKSAHFEETVPQNGFDAVGNLLHKVRRDEIGEEHCRYQYDTLYQLTQEEGIASHSYSYDSINNRLSKDNLTTNVNALNQLLRQGDTSYDYDLRGNRIAKSDTVYHYDPLGRLTEVIKDDKRYVYAYDPFNRRMSKTHYNLSANEWVYKSEEKYLYHQQMEIGAVNDRGDLFQFRTIGQGLGAEIGSAVAIELSGEVFAPIHDHSGHVVTLVNAVTGKVAEVNRYSAFGETTSYKYSWLWGWTPSDSHQNPWRFSSKRFDPESSLINFGRRFYDPETGRWLTPDPKGYDDGPNIYAYVHNSPLLHYDLYGLYSNTKAKPKWDPQPSYQPDPDRSPNRCFGCRVRSFVGDTVSNFGNFLMGPFRRIAIGTGRWIAGNGYTTPMGFECDSCSVRGTCPDRKRSDKTAYTYFNGQYTSFGYGNDCALEMGKNLGDVEVDRVHSETEGHPMDVGESVLLKAGIESRAVQVAVAHLKKQIQSVGGVGGGGNVIVIAHSQGGLVLHNAIQHLNEKERGMLDVVTLGSAKIINDDKLRSNLNIVSKRDLVSMAANPIDLARAAIHRSPHVRFVSCEPGSPFVDHPVMGPTYQKALKRQVDFINSGA